ncbi:MAG: calcium-translocating P-type ATPase, SERCA-type [Candidatus Hodarchaeales archaeon]|jgi:Ca2+-transporting ATPase
MEHNWPSIDNSSLLNKLEVDEDVGLTSDEALARIEKYGFNELQKSKGKPPIVLFFEQFMDPLVIILLVALVISLIIGVFSTNEHERVEYFIDAAAITLIVLFNAFFGFIQEYKAEKSIEALKSMAAPSTTVVRAGVKERIEARVLVPGDIVILEEGDKVPADGKLLQSLALRVDESTLTGESFPVAKDANAEIKENSPLADMSNSVFSGTNVTRGRGQVLVVHTGMNTEFGKIALGLMTEKKEETPLQQRLTILGKYIGVASLSICGLIFGIGILLGREVIEMFIVSVGLAVAAVPEGLPAVVTLALALGVQRMSKKNAIIRRLPSVETLGSTTVICSDKTGTLTMNKMTVRRVISPDNEYKITKSLSVDEHLHKILLIGKECNNAQITINNGENRRVNEIGDPTEIALLRVADRLHLSDVKNDRIYEIPFDSESKRMSVVVKTDLNEHFVYMKGAPDVLLNLCTQYLTNGEIIPLNEEKRVKLEQDEQNLAIKGYRMLGMAYKDITKEEADMYVFSENSEEIEADLIYVGAVAIIDPPRRGTKNAIATCKKAGIRPIMITGDHLKTAMAVANEIGLVDDIDSANAIEGKDLTEMNETQLDDVVLTTNIFARVSPDHKLKLVSALKRHNQVVAMTGDGVNDAPALKRADIGVAMGISGTDVSKEASDMVLADDDFSTIVGAILEGRTIYDNMRKFILYLLSCNAGEITVMFLGMILTTIIFREPILPLLAIQILWVNLVTDGLPALALGVDPPDEDVMVRKPRDPQEPILTKKALYFILYAGIIIGIGTLIIFFVYLWPFIFNNIIPNEIDIIRPRTVAFTMLIVFQMIMALNIRKEEHSLLGKEFYRNPYLLLAITSSVVLHLLIMYLPLFQQVFDTVGLNLFDWILILFIGSFLILIDEIRTILAKRFPQLQNIAGYW